MSIIKRKLYCVSSNEHVKKREVQNENERGQICIRDYAPSEYEELAFMQPSDFEAIFGVKDTTGKRQGSQVVKITNPKNGKSVHRLYRTSYEIRGIHDYVGLSYTSIKNIINSENEFNNLQEVIVSKGNRFMFYMMYPNYAIRVSLWIGAISIIIGVLSIFLTILFKLS